MKKKLMEIYMISLILIIIDQITKYLFIDKNYFSNFMISIKYSQNSGSAFSLFANIDFYNYIIIVLSIIVLILIIFYNKYFLNNKILSASYIFLIAGVIGNLIDRIFFGYVHDFIAIKYLFIFNIADVYLNLAILAYLYYELKYVPQNQKTNI